MKRTSLLCLLLIVAMMAFAAPVSLERAQRTAQNFLMQRGLQTELVARPAPDGLGHLRFFTGSDGIGFVIIADDDRSLPVLGYSISGRYDPDLIPESALEWLGTYNIALSVIAQDTTHSQRDALKEWRKLEQTSRSDDNPSDTVAPLLSTLWAQETPCNDSCPLYIYEPDSPRCYVGCTGLVVAQIMRYWEFPDRGVGQIPVHLGDTIFGSFRGAFVENLSLGALYDWENMEPNAWLRLTAQQSSAIAQLCYHAAASISTRFGHRKGSSAYMDSIPPAMQRYFRYANTMQIISAMYMSHDDWNNTLKAELRAGRPIAFSGGGHAFVCDGFDSEDRFHFCFGWRGHLDGFFFTDLIDPGDGYNYGPSARAIIGIQPDSTYFDQPDTDGVKLIDIQNAKLQVWTEGRNAIVSIPSATAEVRVYDINGRLVASRRQTNSIERYALPSAGVYIVETESGSCKVVVK